MVELIFKRIRFLLNKPKKKKARKDFGHFLLALPSQPLPKPEFELHMKKKKIKKLDAELVKQLEDMYTIKKNNKIDIAAMVQAYMNLWPDTILPPPKPKKGKKGKQGKKGKKGKKETTPEGPAVLPLKDESPVEGQPVAEDKLPVNEQQRTEFQMPVEQPPGGTN